MRISKMFAWAVLAAGVFATGSQARAEERGWQDRDVRHDQRDLRNDHVRMDRLRAEISLHRARLNEDLRCRRYDLAAQERREIARAEASLNAKSRDIRHDRAELSHDRW